MERLNGLSDGRDSTMLCISLSSWDWDGYLISLATGAMRCRILIGVLNAIAGCGLSAAEGVVHVWVDFPFASADVVVVVAIVYDGGA